MPRRAEAAAGVRCGRGRVPAVCSGDFTVSTCGGAYDTSLEVFSGDCNNLVFIACNDDACGVQSSITVTGVTLGATYYIRLGGWNSSVGTTNLAITLDPTCYLPFGVEGVAEATLGAGSKATTGGNFRDLNWLRWNYLDPQNVSNGKFAAAVFNFGVAGAPPSGITIDIPGFNQVWSGSMPTGTALASALSLLPAGDQSLIIPPSFFLDGDTIRIQALLLDPVNALGALPVVPSNNSLLFTKTSCIVAEGFDALANGVGNYPAGWSNGGGVRQWQVHSGTTPSSGTGPASGAFAGPKYMYCETSSPAATGNTFIMNTAVYPSAGVSSLQFALSRVGATIGTLEVRMGDGTGTFPTLLQTYTGPGSDWTQEMLPLTSLPANVQFQFHYTRGTSFTGDIAIDSFCLR